MSCLNATHSSTMSTPDQFYTQQQSQGLLTSPRPQSRTFDTDTPPLPPPKPASQDASRRASPSYNGPPLPPTPGSQDTPEAQNIHQANHGLTSFEPPRISSPSLEDGWLPAAVQDKTTKDLAQILSDPSLLNALACTHPSYQESLQHLETALATNSEQVKQVQATQDQIDHLRSDIQSLLLQHTTLSAQWRRKQSDMDAALKPWSPQSMYQRLVAGIGEQEALLRAVEESFLEGDSETGAGATEREVSEWIRRVREGTGLLEKRREARARWDEGRVGGWR